MKAVTALDAGQVWILKNQLDRCNVADAVRIEIALLKADLKRFRLKLGFRLR